MGVKLTMCGFLMINGVCQLAWGTGYPHIWANNILGVSVLVFLEEISI